MAATITAAYVKRCVSYRRDRLCFTANPKSPWFMELPMLLPNGAPSHGRQLRVVGHVCRATREEWSGR